MIKVLLYSPRGHVTGSVDLSLNKAMVAAELLKAARDPDESGISTRDMERLDSGTLPMSKLRAILSPDKIRSAAHRSLVALDVDHAHERSILEALSIGDWTRAQGGSGAEPAYRGVGAFSGRPRRLGSDGQPGGLEE